MKKFLLSFLSICMCGAVSAQRVYFIYMQSEEARPFHVRLGDEVMASVSGYLIIPNLPDSSFLIATGFSAEPQKEERFQLTLGGSDRGFLLRPGQDGLVLQDLQRQSTIAPLQRPRDLAISYETRNDPFSVLLSKASSGPGLLFVPVYAKAEPAAEKPKAEVAKVASTPQKTEAPALARDTAGASTETTAQVEASGQSQRTGTATTRTEAVPAKDTVAVEMAKTDLNPATDTVAVTTTDTLTAVVRPPARDSAGAARSDVEPFIAATDTAAAAPETPFQRPVVKRYSESSNSEGFGLVFTDTEGDVTDTIRLVIPNPRIQFRQPDTAAAEDSSFFLVRKDSLTQSAEGREAPKEAPVAQAKSRCTDMATERDFLRLRRNMAGRETEEGMVEEAKRSYKGKCFTTEQVRNLGSLFLTSAGKYQFFDAIYLRVSDPEQFPTLGAEIRDTYYQKRFKALIGE